MDIDVENDTPVYIDPSAIKNLPDEWAQQCLEMLGTFFDAVLDAVKGNDEPRLRDLLIRLQEPNETHFGLSKGRSRGRGLGRELVQKICDNLTMSRAAETGILEDLEDTALFIAGIDKDIISDVTTNVIRGMLIAYTQSVCAMYSIPLEDNVYSGLAWDPVRRDWVEGFTRLPVAKEKPFLLVPKIIVRYDLQLTKDAFFRRSLAPALQREEQDKPASKLVKTAKNGQKYVNKGDIEKEYGGDKGKVAGLTFDRPDIFRAFKEEARKNPSSPLSHDQLSDATGTPRVDFDKLLTDVLAVSPGSADAFTYQTKVEALLSALFYPSLTQPVIEHELNEGRKRVDIVYTNVARVGFFDWLTRQRILCPYIFVECKNYASDLANPELDQLYGRLSPIRGKVGLLVCRSLENKDRFIQRCRDVAHTQRSFILVLDDDDLYSLVDEAKKARTLPEEIADSVKFERPEPQEFRLLHERFRALVS
ncbi:hypothetical protein AB0L44_11955 [Nonomuraea wenchangensis]|uniref:hypothetical protein n=1 Tax=Nonomuraea wenchangensis TaxID=568860 RepID=UPI00341CA43D